MAPSAELERPLQHGPLRPGGGPRPHEPQDLRLPRIQAPLARSVDAMRLVGQAQGDSVAPQRTPEQGNDLDRLGDAPAGGRLVNRCRSKGGADAIVRGQPPAGAVGDRDQVTDDHHRGLQDRLAAAVDLQALEPSSRQRRRLCPDLHDPRQTVVRDVPQRVEALVGQLHRQSAPDPVPHLRAGKQDRLQRPGQVLPLVPGGQADKAVKASRELDQGRLDLALGQKRDHRTGLGLLSQWRHLRDPGRARRTGVFLPVSPWVG